MAQRLLDFILSPFVYIALVAGLVVVLTRIWRLSVGRLLNQFHGRAQRLERRVLGSVLRVARQDRLASDDDDSRVPLAAFGGPGWRAEERDLEQANSALKVYSGKLVERIPRLMRVGRREQIEVRLGTDATPTPTLALGLVGGGALVEHSVHVVETMALDLYSADEGFKIEPLSDREQLVTKEALRGTPLETLSDNYGRWMWNVTPLKVGSKTLALRVSARVLDSHGHPTPHTLVPDKTIDIDVRVDKSALAWRGLLWAGGFILAAILGYFNEALRSVVWPVIQDIFRNVLGIAL